MTINYESAFRWGVALTASAAIIGIVAVSAKAADLGATGGGYKDEVVVSQPGVSWSGVYAGGLLGYGSDRATLGGEATLFENSFGLHTDTSLTGFVGTLTGGADWHLPSSRWVLGVYGDYTFGDRTGDILGATVNEHDYSIQAKLNNQWAVGGRAGILVTPGTLVFVKLGYTQADESINFVVPGSSVAGWSATANGYNLGGGVEASLGSGWFVRGQYDYSDYGSSTISSGNVGNLASYKITEDFSDNRFTAGLIYKFGVGR